MACAHSRISRVSLNPGASWRTRANGRARPAHSCHHRSNALRLLQRGCAAAVAVDHRWRGSQSSDQCLRAGPPAARRFRPCTPGLTQQLRTLAHQPGAAAVEQLGHIAQNTLSGNPRLPVMPDELRHAPVRPHAGEHVTQYKIKSPSIGAINKVIPIHPWVVTCRGPPFQKTALALTHQAPQAIKYIANNRLPAAYASSEPPGQTSTAGRHRHVTVRCCNAGHRLCDCRHAAPQNRQSPTGTRSRHAHPEPARASLLLLAKAKPLAELQAMYSGGGAELSSTCSARGICRFVCTRCKFAHPPPHSALSLAQNSHAA